jgi:hypothetical protein
MYTFCPGSENAQLRGKMIPLVLDDTKPEDTSVDLLNNIIKIKCLESLTCSPACVPMWVSTKREEYGCFNMFLFWYTLILTRTLTK